jgi:hypothetical protein
MLTASIHTVAGTWAAPLRWVLSQAAARAQLEATRCGGGKIQPIWLFSAFEASPQDGCLVGWIFLLPFDLSSRLPCRGLGVLFPFLLLLGSSGLTLTPAFTGSTSRTVNILARLLYSCGDWLAILLTAIIVGPFALAWVLINLPIRTLLCGPARAFQHFRRAIWEPMP